MTNVAICVEIRFGGLNMLLFREEMAVMLNLHTCERRK